MSIVLNNYNMGFDTYESTSTCPISDLPIIRDFTRPPKFCPDGLDYVIPSVNPRVIILISNFVMTRPERIAEERMSRDNFLLDIINCQEAVFVI